MDVTSAASQFAVSDTAPMSFEDFTTGKAGFKTDDADYGLIGNIRNFFNGKRTEYEKEYDAYLSKFQNDLEEKRLQSARDYETWLDSTKYQRAVEDAKKAGINPYLLFSQNINTSSGSSASAQKAATPEAMSKKVNNASSLVTSALKVLLFAMMLG